jgi:integrase
MRLDAKTIAGLTPPKGKPECVHWDSELPGFGLRSRRRGEKLHRTWIVQYRIAGRSRKATLGDARAVSAAQAREAARMLLAKVALGADPQAERAAKRQAATRTFRAVAALYLEAYRRERRPNSYRVTKLYLTGPYFRPLHAMGVNEIAHADVAARIRSIQNNHSAPTASAARRAVSALFAWAIAEGLLGRNPVNPVIGTRRPADPTPRDRVLTNDELAAIWKATEDDPQALEGWRDYSRVIRLLMLLGARANEVGGMTWAEIDVDAGVWTLPKERSKNGRAHAILLPKPALDIVAGARRRPEGKSLFGSPRLGFKRWASMKAELDRRLGDQVKPWRAHDLRRSAATHMAEIGVMPHIIEAALNHYSGHRSGIAGVYNRARYDREVAAALARWSEHLLAAVEGRVGGDRVVPLRA